METMYSIFQRAISTSSRRRKSVEKRKNISTLVEKASKFRRSNRRRYFNGFPASKKRRKSVEKMGASLSSTPKIGNLKRWTEKRCSWERECDIGWAYRRRFNVEISTVAAGYCIENGWPLLLCYPRVCTSCMSCYTVCGLNQLFNVDSTSNFSKCFFFQREV